MLRAPPWLLFAFVCTAWGSGWVASKLAVGLLPPLSLAAVRGLLVCATMLPLCDLRQLAAALRQSPGRVLLVALLCSTLTHAPIYWGQQYLPAGLAGVMNYGLTPLAFVLFAALAGEERCSTAQGVGVVLGLVGVALLYGGEIQWGGTSAAGLASVVVGTFAFCWGTVVARPLLRGPVPMAPAAVNALQNGIGGLGIAVLALAFEPLRLAAPPAAAWPKLLGAVAFLVLVSGGLAALAYWRLVRDWGSLRAGAYALVCPMVAVLAGAALLDERLSARQWAGCLLMLMAAGWLHYAPQLLAAHVPVRGGSGVD